MAVVANHVANHKPNLCSAWPPSRRERCLIARRHRLACRQAIYTRLQGCQPTGPSGVADSLVCSVEAELYGSAATREEYEDRTTLEARLLRVFAAADGRTHGPPQNGPQVLDATLATAPQPVPAAAAPAGFGLAPPDSHSPAVHMLSAELEGTQHSPVRASWPGQPQLGAVGMGAEGAGQPSAKRSRQSTPSLMQGNQQPLTDKQQQHVLQPAQQALPSILQPQQQQSNPLQFFTSAGGAAGSVLPMYQQAVQQCHHQQQGLLQWQQQLPPLARAGSAPPATTLHGAVPRVVVLPQQQTVHAGATAGGACAAYQPTHITLSHQQLEQQQPFSHQPQQQQQQVYALGATLQAAWGGQQVLVLPPQPLATRAPSAPPLVGGTNLATPAPATGLAGIQQLHLAPHAVQQQQQLVPLDPTLPLSLLPQPHQQQQVLCFPSGYLPSSGVMPLLPPQQLGQHAHNGGPLLQSVPQAMALPASAAATPQQLQLFHQHWQQAAVPGIVGQQQVIVQQMGVPAAQQAPLVQQVQQRQQQQAGQEDDNESTGSHTSPATGPGHSASELVTAASELCMCPLTHVSTAGGAGCCGSQAVHPSRPLAFVPQLCPPGPGRPFQLSPPSSLGSPCRRPPWPTPWLLQTATPMSAAPSSSGCDTACTPPSQASR